VLGLYLRKLHSRDKVYNKEYNDDLQLDDNTNINNMKIAKNNPNFNPYLSKNKNKIPYHINSSNSKNVPEYQKECSSGRFTERKPINRCLNICILIQKLHNLLEAPHTTLENAHKVL
jgi:hypothetical protein